MTPPVCRHRSIGNSKKCLCFLHSRSVLRVLWGKAERLPKAIQRPIQQQQPFFQHSTGSIASTPLPRELSSFQVNPSKQAMCAVFACIPGYSRHSILLQLGIRLARTHVASPPLLWIASQAQRRSPPECSAALGAHQAHQLVLTL